MLFFSFTCTVSLKTQSQLTQSLLTGTDCLLFQMTRHKMGSKRHRVPYGEVEISQDDDQSDLVRKTA